MTPTLLPCALPLQLPLTDECRVVPWSPDAHRPPPDLRVPPPDPTASPRAIDAWRALHEIPPPVLLLPEFEGKSQDGAWLPGLWQPWHWLHAARNAAAAATAAATAAGSTAEPGGSSAYGLEYAAEEGGAAADRGRRRGRELLQDPEEGHFRYVGWRTHEGQVGGNTGGQ